MPKLSDGETHDILMLASSACIQLSANTDCGESFPLVFHYCLYVDMYVEICGREGKKKGWVGVVKA